MFSCPCPSLQMQCQPRVCRHTSDQEVHGGGQDHPRHRGLHRHHRPNCSTNVSATHAPCPAQLEAPPVRARDHSRVARRAAFCPGRNGGWDCLLPACCRRLAHAPSCLARGCRPPPAPPGPMPMCSATASTDIQGGHLSKACDQKTHSCLAPGKTTQQQCCDGCTAAKDCTAWVYVLRAAAPHVLRSRNRNRRRRRGRVPHSLRRAASLADRAAAWALSFGPL